MTPVAAVLDTHGLIELVYVSLIAGVAICAVYALAVVGLTRAQERRRGQRPVAAALYATLAAVSLGACGWAIVMGLTIMARK